MYAVGQLELLLNVNALYVLLAKLGSTWSQIPKWYYDTHVQYCCSTICLHPTQNDMVRTRCAGTHAHTYYQKVPCILSGFGNTDLYFTSVFNTCYLLLWIIVRTIITFIAKRQRVRAYLSRLISAWDTLTFVFFSFLPARRPGGPMTICVDILSTVEVTLVESYGHILWP